MTRFLLDVNVLIALVDDKHTNVDRAHRWFASDPEIDWLICPLVQLGVIRIVGNSRCSTPFLPIEAVESLQTVMAIGRCSFVPDGLDLLNVSVFDHSAILTSGHVPACSRREVRSDTCNL